MYRHRDTSSTIWRTVVFAGAMLGVPACGHDAKPVQTTPANTAATPPPPADPVPAPTAPVKPDPTPAAAEADPCGGGAAMPMTPTADDPQPTDATAQPNDKKRPRGGGSRPTGRGFVLA
jgi:hypothetical protein